MLWTLIQLLTWDSRRCLSGSGFDWLDTACMWFPAWLMWKGINFEEKERETDDEKTLKRKQNSTVKTTKSCQKRQHQKRWIEILKMIPAGREMMIRKKKGKRKNPTRQELERWWEESLGKKCNLRSCRGGKRLVVGGLKNWRWGCRSEKRWESHECGLVEEDLSVVFFKGVCLKGEKP